MKKSLLFLFLIVSGWAQGQIRIDSNFTFLAIPEKEYSIYVPSSYDAQTSNRMMVGFHPFNTNRWDAISWCDTLINFAETNDLILVCPDGGNDGQVDDPLDTAFTSALIDSMFHWYNIDQVKVYAMGFSVGGRATYTYGLNHINRLWGFMPIGAAVNGTTEVDPFIQNASGRPYYIIHGTLDAEALRFTPVKDALINNGAIVNFNLLSGVGHTIDFANRNQILTDGFIWLDSVNCAVQDSLAIGIAPKVISTTGLIQKGSNQLSEGQSFSGIYKTEKATRLKASVISLSGQIVWNKSLQLSAGENAIEVPIGEWEAGLYLIQLAEGNQRTVEKIFVKGK